MSVEIILVDGRRKLLRARRGWRVREVMTEKSISWGEISALIVDRLRPTFESLSVHYFNPPPPRKGRKVGERMEPAISHPTLSLLPQKSKPSSFLPWGPLFPSDPSIGRVSRSIDAVCPGSPSCLRRRPPNFGSYSKHGRTTLGENRLERGGKELAPSRTLIIESIY